VQKTKCVRANTSTRSKHRNSIHPARELRMYAFSIKHAAHDTWRAMCMRSYVRDCTVPLVVVLHCTGPVTSSASPCTLQLASLPVLFNMHTALAEPLLMPAAARRLFISRRSGALHLSQLQPRRWLWLGISISSSCMQRVASRSAADGLHLLAEVPEQRCLVLSSSSSCMRRVAGRSVCTC
jgi:hypothetical protein